MPSFNFQELFNSDAIKKLEDDDDFLKIELSKDILEKQGLISKSDVTKPKRKRIRKKFTFFLDIDSTITDEDSDLPDPRCKPVFEQIQKKYKHKIFFISGRPIDKVRSVIKTCKAKPHAIVENGGLIINSRKIIATNGDKKLCESAYRKLKPLVSKMKKARGVGNTTEVILEKNGTISTIRKYIKSENLSVEINTSKRFYHLHKSGIHKGYGLTRFMADNNIDYRYSVAIGDSEIDLPMIKKVKYAFLVANAPATLKKRVNPDSVLKNKSFDGVLEAMMIIEPRIKPFIKKEKFLK